VKRVVIAGLVTIAYAWWLTAVAPFTWLSYTLIALPSLMAIGLYVVLGAYSPRRADIAVYYRSRSQNASLSSVTPWLVLLLGAVILETVGLALGGRSKAVPTLSTTVDHLLVTHEGRALLFVAWLLVGVAPLWRLWQQHPPRSP
jgi:hypothetical protein